MMFQGQTRDFFFPDLITVDDLLSGLDPCFAMDLSLIKKNQLLSAGTVVFARGDEPNFVYIHRSGRVALFQDDIKDEGQACPVEPNCIYGMVEVLAGSVFGISMMTLTNSEFDLIDRDDLVNLLQIRPALCFRLAEILSQSYKNALQNIKSTDRT